MICFVWHVCEVGLAHWGTLIVCSWEWVWGLAVGGQGVLGLGLAGVAVVGWCMCASVGWAN